MSAWKCTLKACIDRNSACIREAHFLFLNYENIFELPDKVDWDSTFKENSLLFINIKNMCFWILLYKDWETFANVKIHGKQNLQLKAKKKL